MSLNGFHYLCWMLIYTIQFLTFEFCSIKINHMLFFRITSMVHLPSPSKRKKRKTYPFFMQFKTMQYARPLGHVWILLRWSILHRWIKNGVHTLWVIGVLPPIGIWFWDDVSLAYGVCAPRVSPIICWHWQ